MINDVVFEDKYEEYLYLYNVVPKISWCNFEYIKKVKQKSSEANAAEIANIAEMLELPQREVRYMIDNKYIKLNNNKQNDGN